MKVKNLSKLAPTKRVAFVLTDIRSEHGDGKPVVLWLEHTERNPAYKNALDRLKHGPGNEEAVRARIPAFARYGVRDWEHAFDDVTGEPEKYSPEAVERLLIDLVDNGGLDLVSEAMVFAMSPRNFRDMLDEGAAERVGNG